VGGVLVVCTETTQAVLAKERREAESIRQRRLFEQAPGFIIIMRGPDHIVDFVNDAHRSVFNSDGWTGKTIRDAFPSIAGQGYFEVLDRVYATGETFETDAAEVVFKRTPDGPDETRFLTFIYAPLHDDEGRITGIFCEGFDVTERKRSETHTAALAALADRLRDLEDPDEIAYASAETLGRIFGVSRAGYGTIEKAAETITIERDWNADGIKSLAGVLHFRDYGSYIEDLKRGETVVVADADADPRTASNAAALKAISARSFVNMPITEQGGFVALLYLNHKDPRRWSEQDIAIVRDIADRTRTAVERRRAEAELRQNESRLRFLDALSQAAASATGADEILALTTRLLGEYLAVSVCAYADMDADEDMLTIRGDWSKSGVASIVGRYSLSSFGQRAADELHAGRPLISTDNRSEARLFIELGLHATICMPLLRNGRLTALMAIHDDAPRRWRDEELTLLREVAERSWSHIERLGAEAELRASEENFRTLSRAMPNHVWTALPDGALDWFNEQVYAYGGAPPGSLDGGGWTDMVHPDDLPVTAARWAEALRTGETYQTEFRLRRADGAYRWHIARAVPIKSAGRVTRWIGTNTDIQDQKESAEALADMNAALEARVAERTGQLMAAEEALRQSQKMEAIGHLTGGIAHDFNNLLGAIGGSFSLIQRRITDKASGADRYIAAGQEAVQRAASLTQRLLAFSRRQTLDPKPIDVNKLVGGMEDLIRRTVGPDVEVEIVGAAGLWPTRVDPSQLESSLLNLSINGRDAMAPDGGRLTIETANKWLDERAARERDLKPGQYISLCVTDTGTGMAPDVIERAFDPFFTTKPIGQGTGLGLSMVYGFVRQSGGQVRIYSELGKGTTMCLYLPRYVGEVEEEADSESQAPLANASGETVLVIDDEPTLRMLIADVLEESGYRVLQAGSGPDGLRVIQSGATIDLLITDVGLPGGMNGRQVADAARIHRPGLKILFITGYAENAAIGNGHLERGMAILTKPFEISVLSDRVREMIDGDS
jgi:PAS domain S-box-containing protein